MSFKRVSVIVALAGLVALGPLGCAEVQSPLKSNKVTYLESARLNYEKGQKQLKDENYIEALTLFNYVKTKFPFSLYATLAELRIADTFFAQDKFLEAIDNYKVFLKFHPTHAEVSSGYVSFRIGQAHFKQIPGDWFLLPPSYEKDQAATKDALRTLSDFVKSYPRSKYLPEAKKLHGRCLRRLAEHELYVARFYLDRNKPKATILRLETLLRRYPEAGMDPEVMLLLGQTYLKLDQKQKAEQTFALLIQKHPEDAHSAKARVHLKSLKGQRR